MRVVCDVCTQYCMVALLLAAPMVWSCANRASPWLGCCGCLMAPVFMLYFLTLGAFIAGIYVTLDQEMDGVVSLGWGVGVSVVTILVDILIACVPVYPVL